MKKILLAFATPCGLMIWIFYNIANRYFIEVSNQRKTAYNGFEAYYTVIFLWVVNAKIRQRFSA